MLDLDTRKSIFRLRDRGNGTRKIARELGISRGVVRKVLQSGEAEVPPLARPERLTPHIRRIRELHESCKGNLLRVHEELDAEGVEVGYSTLTAFCRRNGIGTKPKKRVGEYHFSPGEEMQHDTSPHDVVIGGRRRRLQCASLVLCYSRRRFAQVYPRFNRFTCRLFLTDALRYNGGSAETCMIDNTSVIIAHGTGPDAVPAPEMAAFEKRFRFSFVAHKVGDANRSARVERPFHHIENNFYAGRTFSDLDDLNRRLLEWCEAYNTTMNKRLGFNPQDRFLEERSLLTPLPLHVPEVYEAHVRRVDTGGYVTVHTNRYSVDEDLIGRQLQVLETRDHIRVMDGHRLVVEHEKRERGACRRITLPEHRYLAHRRCGPKPLPPEVKRLRDASPELTALVDALRKRHGGHGGKAVKRLVRIHQEYPTEAVVKAVKRALDFGLYDIGRIERMVLENVRGDFFRMPIPHEPGPDRSEHE